MQNAVGLDQISLNKTTNGMKCGSLVMYLAHMVLLCLSLERK